MMKSRKINLVIVVKKNKVQFFNQKLSELRADVKR